EAITQVRAALDGAGTPLAVGAGSVLTPDDAEAAVAAGAQFIVAPMTDPAVIWRCRLLEVACMPGALTPTEIVSAWHAGASVVKVFPARALGPSYIKDLREPLPFLRLMPTGGIGVENIAAYVQA